MAKKISKYQDKNLYRTKKPNRWLKVVCWIGSIVILFYGGFYGGSFVLNMINKEPKQEVSDVQDVSTSAEPNGQISSSSTSEDGKIEDTSDKNEDKNSYGKSTIINNEILSNITKLDAQLKSLKQDGYNTVVFELKNDQGMIYYNSAIEDAQKVEAIVKNPVDITALSKTFSDNDIKGIPIINTFKDAKYATKTPNSAIWYNNQKNYLWFDNYPDKGGKPWLNPYSGTARKYLTDIIDEITKQGFDMVLLDNVKFGAVEGNKLAGFGPESSGISRLDALKTFVLDCSAAAEKNNANVSVITDLENIINGKDKFLNDSILNINPKYISPVIQLENLTKNIVINEKTFEKATDSPKEITEEILKLIKTKKPDVKIMPILKDYDNIKELLIPALTTEQTIGYIKS